MGIAAVLLAACALAVTAGLFYLGTIHNNVLEEVARTRQARLAAYGLMQASIDAETGQRGFLLTRDAQFLEPFDSGRARAYEHLARLNELTMGQPDLQEPLQRTHAIADHAFEELQSILQQRRSGAMRDRQFRAALVTSKGTMDTLRRSSEELLHAIEQRVDAARALERRTGQTLYWTGALLAALTLIAVALTVLALRNERRSWNAALKALTEANDAAEEARARAAESNLAKTRFLAVASHDMRQPLHALTLYLSALERRVETAEARDIIGKMERATRSMVDMFSTLLDLARIQSGVITPENTIFPLQQVLDRIAAEHPSGAVKISNTPVYVDSDPVLVERILRNLVTNAIKHGGGGAQISATASGGAIAISVADNGPGIPEQDQARIFDEFVRLDGGGDGLGLGLSIVKHVADLLGMELSLESKAGQGARFTLRAPIAQTASETAPQANVGAFDLARAPVLVVDDDTLAREAVVGAMSDLGAEVRQGGNEAEARAVLAQGFVPRLILMDLRIDGRLAGIDIVRRLCATMRPAPRVVIITGDTGPETLALLRASGFAWLIKPVSPEALSRMAAEELRAA